MKLLRRRTFAIGLSVTERELGYALAHGGRVVDIGVVDVRRLEPENRALAVERKVDALLQSAGEPVPIGVTSADGAPLAPLRSIQDAAGKCGVEASLFENGEVRRSVGAPDLPCTNRGLVATLRRRFLMLSEMWQDCPAPSVRGKPPMACERSIHRAALALGVAVLLAERAYRQSL